MQQFITRIQTNLNGVLEMTQMFDGLMMTGDDLANRVIVELNRDGTPVPITNEYQIVGYIIRNDGYTLDIPGEIIENGHACIDIPAIAYEVSGPLSIAIRMVSVSNKIVIATASCYVNTTETNAIIDTSHRIPDVEDLLTKIEEFDAKMDAMDAAEALRSANEANRATAETVREASETARAQAFSETIYKVDGMTISITRLPVGSEPTATITEVDGHKHIAIGIPPGDAFRIQKSFPSVADMMAYSGPDVHTGDFVIISSTPSDPDNGDLYWKTENSYQFICDMSGAQGIQGPKGDKGDTGNTGPQGEKGDKGDKGDPGDTGPKGDKGDTGEKGDKGDTGEAGPKGDTGAPGPQGPKGDTGDRGPKGDPGSGTPLVNYDSTNGVLNITFT